MCLEPRVLTSKEYVEILNERRQAEEEKEQWKIKREKKERGQKIHQKAKRRGKTSNQERLQSKASSPDQPRNLKWKNNLQMHLHQALLQEPNIGNLWVVTVTVIIEVNQCCVCFQTFKDDKREQSGLTWVECACSRWLHEEFIEYDLSVNARGQKLLCPFCCL